MRILWGILLGSLLFALPARADQIYDVTATVTMTGSDVCGGLCVEVLDFTLRLDEVLTSHGYALETLAESYTSTGPLPPAEMADRFNDNGEYWAVGFGPGTELDLYVRGVGGGTNPVDGPDPFVPLFVDAGLYSCGDATCGAEFCPDYPAVVCSSGAAVQSVTVAEPQELGDAAVPEPATWGLLLCGMALLPLGLSVCIPLKLRRLLDGARGLAV
jgi:hypothetical protein